MVSSVSVDNNICTKIALYLTIIIIALETAIQHWPIKDTYFKQT